MIVTALSKDSLVVVRRGAIKHSYRVHLKTMDTGVPEGSSKPPSENDSYKLTFDRRTLMVGSKESCRDALDSLRVALIKDQRRSAIQLIMCGVAAIGLIFSASCLMRPSVSPQDVRNAILSMQGMSDDGDGDDAEINKAGMSATAMRQHSDRISSPSATSQTINFSNPVPLPYKPVPVTLASDVSPAPEADPKAAVLHDHNFSIPGSDVSDTNSASGFFKDFSGQ